MIFSYVLATYGKYVTITLRLGLAIYCILSYVRIMLQIFSYNNIFFMTLGLHSFVVCCIRMEITYGNYVSFLFVIVIYFLFRCNYVVYLFDIITFINDIINRYCFGTSELRMEITLQLRFMFVPHCDLSFILLKLRYLFVRCSYVFRFSLQRIFYYVTVKLFACSI